jgi:hypothetical protein
MKIRPVGAVFLHADGQIHEQTDMHGDADSSFPQFCERSYKLMANMPSIGMTYIGRIPSSVSEVEDGEVTWRPCD